MTTPGQRSDPAGALEAWGWVWAIIGILSALILVVIAWRVAWHAVPNSYAGEREFSLDLASMAYLVAAIGALAAGFWAQAVTGWMTEVLRELRRR